MPRGCGGVRKAALAWLARTTLRVQLWVQHRVIYVCCPMMFGDEEAFRSEGMEELKEPISC